MTTIITKQQEFLNALKNPIEYDINLACKKFLDIHSDCITFMRIVNDNDDDNEEEYAIKLTTNNLYPIHISEFPEVLIKHANQLKILTSGPYKDWAYGEAFHIKYINEFSKIFYLIKK